MNDTAMIFDSYPRPTCLSDVLEAGIETRSVSWLARIQQVLANWAHQATLSHVESPLWDIAQSDPRVMAELMLARKGDDSADAAPVPAMSPLCAADTVAAVVPKSLSLLGQGWGRVIEDAYQTRTHSGMWRSA